MMSKKDYELISKVMYDFSNQDDNCCYNLHYAIVESLAEAFGKDNPKFDREKFDVACGLFL